MSGELIDRPRLRRSLEAISHRAEVDEASAAMRPWVEASLVRDVEGVSTFVQYGRQFEFRSDEAQERGGHDAAPSPMRYLLSAIAFCLIGWCAKTWAAQDVAVTSLDVHVRTLLDMRGEHRVSDVPPHPQWFVLEVRIDDDTTPERSVALLREAVARCPITALIDRAVPVHLMLVQRGWTVLDTRPDPLRSENRQEQTR